MAAEYDLIIVGGGLGGASLGKAMAEEGARVLILERETQFRDRIRGEGMHPWGVAEARALGIYDILKEGPGHEVRWWNVYVGDQLMNARDLPATSPHQAGSLNFYHPAMQESLLESAAKAGAEVRRGASAVGPVPGQPSQLSVEENGAVRELTARLVVGADGRGSRVRQWLGLTLSQDPERLLVSGLSMEGLSAPEDAVHLVNPPAFGETGLIFPVGGGRFRVYFVAQRGYTERKMSGTHRVPAFVEACVSIGMPAEWFEGATPAGPLAEFDGASHWVSEPYVDGVVLIGDAAGASDPSWGCGLSLTLRDARVLRDELRSGTGWPEACARYSAQRRDYFAALHRVEEWYARLFYDLGPEADAYRMETFPKLMRGEAPDIIGLGPEAATAVA